jgi:cyclophilin family peptidyl-prolyl cis-trans isomerase
MFKENRDFWLYFIGIIVLFLVLFSVLKNGFGNKNSMMFSFWPILNKSTGAILAQPEVRIDTTKDYQAVITTSEGAFTVKLFAKNAPNTVSSFLYLVNNKLYTDTKFYYLVPGFLIQGGSPTTKNSDPNDDRYGGPGYTTPDEVNWDSLDFDQQLRVELTKEGYKSAYALQSIDLDKYTVAMASSGPNTLGSQFFILYADKKDPRVLNMRGRHTVFGLVTQGRDVVDRILKMPVDNASAAIPRPQKDIVIKDIQIIIK